MMVPPSSHHRHLGPGLFPRAGLLLICLPNSRFNCLIPHSGQVGLSQILPPIHFLYIIYKCVRFKGLLIASVRL